MTEDMIEQIDQCIDGRSGPFTNYAVDEPLLGGVVAWIDGDWQRLRSLLNYVHDAGMATAYFAVSRNVDNLNSAARHRMRKMQNNLKDGGDGD